MYKTPSPVTAKRRLSGIPTSRRTDRVASDQVLRIQREWPGLEEREQRSRRGSIATSGELLKNLKEEADSVDSSMGFRELERVCARVEEADGSILRRLRDRILI
jgi:hypothetical protein